MTYEIQKPSATQLTIAVRAAYDELEPLLKPAAGKISSEIEIEGFRRGHAPYEVVKQRVGEFKLLEKAAKLYIQKNFERILKDIEDKENRENKDKPFETVGVPEVAITKLVPGEEMEFKITLSFLPPIELPDYRAIAKRVLTGKKTSEVTEQEIKSSLNWLRESRTKLITVNRGAAAGDRVEIDFSANSGGVKLDGGESKNHPLILGQNRFLPGLEEELTGLKAGEEKSFTLAVPRDWRDKILAGKAVEFKAKMNLVQERQVPEWNDEFAKSLGNFSSAVEVEKSVADGLKMEKEGKERERLRLAMVEAIAGETRAKIPEALIERELEKMLVELERSVAGMGMKFSDYLGHIKKTAEDLKKEWRPDAERRVKIALVLREIARKENIQPSGEEIQAAANRTAAHQGITEEDLKKLDPHTHWGDGRAAIGRFTPMSVGVDRQAFLDYHKGLARNEKVLEFLEKL